MTASPGSPPSSAPRDSFAPLAKCFRVTAGVASAAAWRPRRTGSWRGTAKESGWISCGTGTCGSSSAASRSCRSAILRWRPAGNWWPQSTEPARGPGPGAVPPRSRPANQARRGAAPPPTCPCPCPAPPLCAGPVITLPSELRREGSGRCTSRALAGSSFRPFHFPTIYPVHSELFHSVFPASSLSRIKGKSQSVCHYILDKQPLLCCPFPIHWLFFFFFNRGSIG